MVPDVIIAEIASYLQPDRRLLPLIDMLAELEDLDYQSWRQTPGSPSVRYTYPLLGLRAEVLITMKSKQMGINYSMTFLERYAGVGGEPPKSPDELWKWLEDLSLVLHKM